MSIYFNRLWELALHSLGSMLCFYSMEHRLIQNQSQKLVLSPQIRQYLKLLQMPSAELQAEVDTLLEENPVVEVKSESLSTGSAQEESPVVPDSLPQQETRELQFGKGNQAERLDHFEQENFGAWGEDGEALEDPESLQRTKNFQDGILTREESLEDFLLTQIRTQDFSEEELKAVPEFIGDLNALGFLVSPLEDIATRAKLDLKIAEAFLTKLQQLDPPGIFARNLQETLILQIQRKQPLPELALRILREGFALLVRRDLPGLSKLLEVDIESLRSSVEMIQKLDPRPARDFQHPLSTPIVPDVFVLAEEADGEILFRVEVRQEALPQLRISRMYRNLLRNPSTDQATKIFIREKIQKAQDFLSGLEMRGSTLKNLAEFIVKVQRDFFLQGFTHLKPLRMKDAAEALGLHESSISRAVSGKYMATPQGVVPMRSFFSNRMDTDSGESESQRSIMERIRVMIAAEDPKKPLSDQSLVAQLKAEGIPIARRTVAKYRELLKILPTHLRRKR